MTLEKKDFIEIEFTGKVKDGEIFDSNIKEDLKELHSGHNHEIESTPFIFCLGENMFMKGVDEFLIGKDIGNYEISLPPEKAFGKRDPKLIRMVPIKEFSKNNLNPIPGSAFNFDGKIAKVLTVSSGRVIVDFNHPISGKNVEYKIKVLRNINDLNEKIKALNEFFFRTDFEFTTEENKLTLHVPKNTEQFVKIFKEKYKEILNLELEVKEIEKKSKDFEEKKE